MKKWLIVAFGLMVVMLLSGCGNKWNSESEVAVQKVSLEDLYGKTSLTTEDLNALDELLFPASYSYETYQLEDWSIADAGEYVYTDTDHILLPIHEKMVNREITSSSIEDWMIYTRADLTLDDESIVSALYINDLNTLKYGFAAVYTDTDTTLYTFSY